MQLASGPGWILGLGGQVFLVQTSRVDLAVSQVVLEIRSMNDGALLGTLSIAVAPGEPQSFGVATDGSYVCGAYSYFNTTFTANPVLATWARMARSHDTSRHLLQGRHRRGSPTNSASRMDPQGPA